MPRHPPPEIEIKSDNQRRLVELAHELFGDYWQRPLTKALGVHPFQVQRWVKGDYEPSDEIVEQLGAMARRKAMRLMKVARVSEER